jgi:hypothetical protein
MTMAAFDSARARVERLVAAARRIADPRDPLGIEARDVLPRVTGLSGQGVELAFTRCLETAPDDAELQSLVRSVAPAPRAHVLLSANVFVAAHRAIALALAASTHVIVRPSRREPEMTDLLARGAPELFRVASALEPEPGDHVFAYGSDATMATVRATLPPSVTLHAHGSGLGVVAVDARSLSPDERDACARDLADDVILFDQRGCLSPRVAAVLGTAATARQFALALAAALAEREQAVPLGLLSQEEASQVTRYRDAVRYAAEIHSAGRGWVGVDVAPQSVVVPPSGRNVHVIRADDVNGLAVLGGRVAAFAARGSAALGPTLAAMFPGARASEIGRMQSPPFDGPVECRLQR